MNYARYPADKVGLASSKVLYQYGRAVYDIGNYLNTTSPITTNDEPSFNHWPDSIDIPKRCQDPLSWNPRLGWNANDDAHKSRMRWIELAAISPDLFDITHYSIEPDFYNNYFTRMRDGFFNRSNWHEDTTLFFVEILVLELIRKFRTSKN